MENHMEICRKLFHQNKINAKNAWHLRMIEYLEVTTMLYKMRNTVQTAVDLEVCAMIYSIKVDHIHADSLKLASNIGRTAHKSNDDGNDEEVLDGAQQGATKKTTKRKIVNNPMSLVADIAKLDTATFQTYAADNNDQIPNLFTYKMPLNHEGYKFVPFSDEKEFLNSDDVADENQEDPQLLYPIKIPTLTDFQLCAALRNLKIGEVDPNEDSIEEKPANFNDEVVYDEEGMPVAELDGSVDNSFEDSAAEVSSGDELEHQNIYADRNDQVAQLQSFQPGQHNVRLTEYSFVVEPEPGELWSTSEIFLDATKHTNFTYHLILHFQIAQGITP